MWKNIKKLFNKIKINLKKLNKNIRSITKNSSEIYIIILFDMILCKILYGISSYEYRIYEFYNIKHNKRKTFLSKSRHEFKRKLFINKNILNVINNKDILYKRLKNYLNREVVNIKNLSYKEFENILLENKRILCRNINSKFIDKHAIYDLNDFRGAGFVLEKINENKLLLVEKSFNQNKTLCKINDNLVIINVITLCNGLNSDILSIYISFKDDNKIIKGFVDIEKSCIKGHLRCNNEIYKDDIVEYKIPHLKEIIDLSKKVCLELSEFIELEWSFALTDKNDIYLVDVNIPNDYEFIQLREYLNRNNGILQKYNRMINSLKED